MTQPITIRADTPRVCAYCLLDHEAHGGCFSGKRPSEIRREMDERLAATIETQAAEIERLRGERDGLHLAICGGEDAPGYAASLSHETVLGVLADNYESARRDSQLAWDGETANTWKARALAAEASLAEAVGVFEQLSDCPFLIDAATVPKGKQPFEAPDQVIGSLVITGRHYQAIRDFITKHSGGERE